MFAHGGVVETDIETLLNPCSADQPAGNDERENDDFESPYRQVREARGRAARQERQDEAIGQFDSSEAREIWRDVRKDGVTFIEKTSKDLEIAVYLVESWIRLDGFPGLIAGLELLEGLLERYWDSIHPRPIEEDDEGVEATLYPLSTVDLATPILRIAITADTSRGELKTWQYDIADRNDSRKDDEYQALADRGTNADLLVRVDDFVNAIRETPDEFLKNLDAKLTECQERFDRVDQFLFDKASHDAPDLSDVKDALKTVATTFNRLASDRLEAAAIEVVDGDAATDPSDQPGSGDNQVSIAGPVTTRANAKSLLALSASYFRKHEPHSILSYQLARCVGWCDKKLPELLAELIPSEGDLHEVYKRIGVPIPEKPPESEEQSATNTASSSEVVLPRSSLTCREDALTGINKVAAFFIAEDRHSLVSWQLRECLRLSEMDAPDILRQVIESQSVLSELFKMTGVNDETKSFAVEVEPDDAETTDEANTDSLAADGTTAGTQAGTEETGQEEQPTEARTYTETEIEALVARRFDYGLEKGEWSASSAAIEYSNLRTRIQAEGFEHIEQEIDPNSSYSDQEISALVDARFNFGVSKGEWTAESASLHYDRIRERIEFEGFEAIKDEIEQPDNDQEIEQLIEERIVFGTQRQEWTQSSVALQYQIIRKRIEFEGIESIRMEMENVQEHTEQEIEALIDQRFQLGMKQDGWRAGNESIHRQQVREKIKQDGFDSVQLQIEAAQAANSLSESEIENLVEERFNLGAAAGEWPASATMKYATIRARIESGQADEVTAEVEALKAK